MTRKYSDDGFVYDGGLGWIDPADPMGSLGIECRIGAEYLYYSNVDINEFRVPRHADWPRLRLCLDDAQRRAKPTTTTGGEG